MKKENNRKNLIIAWVLFISGAILGFFVEGMFYSFSVILMAFGVILGGIVAYNMAECVEA